MIKIEYEDKKKSIENIYKEWFEKKCLNNIKELLKSYEKLIEIIFYKEDKDKSYYNNIKEYLLKDEESLDEEIIKYFLLEPEKHFKYVRQFGEKPFDEIQNAWEKKGKKETTINKINEFFKSKYENFRSYTAVQIIKELGIKTCPYCNLDYIDIYYNENKDPFKFTGQLDHYFDKSDYPYLAISLYNLIPSCQKCNHIKTNKKERIFHPYMESHEGLYKFKTEFDDNFNLDYLYGESDEFNLCIEINEQSKYKMYIENSKKILSLHQKYNSRKIEIRDIIKKIYIYNNGLLDEFENEIFDMDNEKSKSSIFNKEDMKKIIFNNDFDQNKHLDRLLSKATYDILKEFDVL